MALRRGVAPVARPRVRVPASAPVDLPLVAVRVGASRVRVQAPVPVAVPVAVLPVAVLVVALVAVQVGGVAVPVASNVARRAARGVVVVHAKSCSRWTCPPTRPKMLRFPRERW